MGKPVIWIDRATADFHEESLLIVMFSGDVELRRRMPRAAFRRFVESSIRMLDEQDLKDQRAAARIGKRKKHT